MYGKNIDMSMRELGDRVGLTEAGLDYNSYDDPDKMWDDFLKAVK